MRRSAWGAIALLALVSGSPLSAAAVPVVDEEAVRAAKAGLGWFLLDHVDRPRNVVAAPCPMLSQEAVNGHLGVLGLTGSARPYGVDVVWDTKPGGGVVALRCGVDVAASADPPDSAAVAFDALMLDGQATFDQYAVRLFGRDVVIADVTVPAAGRIASTCDDGATSCTVAAEFHDLVIVLHASGLPAETGEQVARELTLAATAEIVANLAAVPPP